MLEFHLCPVGGGNDCPFRDSVEESNIDPFLFKNVYFDLILGSFNSTYILRYIYI